MLMAGAATIAVIAIHPTMIVQTDMEDGTATDINYLAIAAVAVLVPLAIFGFIAGFKRTRKAVKPYKKPRRGFGPYGFLLKWLTNNPIAPVLVILLTGAMLFTIFTRFGENGLGVEFFVDQDPEVANLYVSARGNLSIEEKDAIMRVVEDKVLSIDDIESALTIVGEGGGGVNAQNQPKDMIGSVQFEFENWRNRKFGKEIMEEISAATAQFPGVKFELAEQANGPQQGKPINIQLASNGPDLTAATKLVEAKLNSDAGLKDVSTTCLCRASSGSLRSTAPRRANTARTSPPSARWCNWSRAA